MFNIDFCQYMDRRPLESEETALPTEPQPLPYDWSILAYLSYYFVNLIVTTFANDASHVRRRRNDGSR